MVVVMTVMRCWNDGQARKLIFQSNDCYVAEFCKSGVAMCR